tara:strand:+ start:257 stop:772 length:516 start_codon:yes stop_codon:yes gene_type:complete
MSEKFWNSSTLEPKRSHRWLVYLNGSNIPTYVAKKVDKPSFTINETEHKYFGHSFFYPGHVTWETISLTLVDPIEPDTSKTLMDILKDSGYSDPTDHPNGALRTVSKADSVRALGPQVRIEQFTDDLESPVESWTLHNPWIKDAKFGNLAYDSDDMVEIELTIRFDWATIG